MFKNVNLN